MKPTANTKQIGSLLVFGAVSLLIPYTILTSIFEYPVVLRQDTATILTKFHEGGPRLIWTWFAFAMTGIPLIPAYLLIGQFVEKRTDTIRTITTIGIIGLVVQLIGLLRWTFVVPVIAEAYVTTTDAAVKAAAIVSFKTIHQFGGVMLGEHLGQLFTIAWTVMLSLSLLNMKLFPKWLHGLGLISACIYLLAQAELFATVIPGFPVWQPAGFIGSTLWLLWLISLGIQFFKLTKHSSKSLKN